VSATDRTPPSRIRRQPRPGHRHRPRRPCIPARWACWL